jgi:hypothetical protein
MTGSAGTLIDTSATRMTLRIAVLDDAAALGRLAELDSAAPLAGRVLVAERDGVPTAALSVATGAVIADPFESTAQTVHMLRLRRYQLVRQAGGMTPAWRLGPRLAPASQPGGRATRW